MWKREKSAGVILRQDYECGSMRKVQEEFQNQTDNVEVCSECTKNFKTRLRIWKPKKSAGRISRPD